MYVILHSRAALFWAAAKVSFVVLSASYHSSQKELRKIIFHDTNQDISEKMEDVALIKIFAWSVSWCAEVGWNKEITFYRQPTLISTIKQQVFYEHEEKAAAYGRIGFIYFSPHVLQSTCMMIAHIVVVYTQKWFSPHSSMTLDQLIVLVLPKFCEAAKITETNATHLDGALVIVYYLEKSKKIRVYNNRL